MIGLKLIMFLVLKNAVLLSTNYIYFDANTVNIQCFAHARIKKGRRTAVPVPRLENNK